MAPQLRHYQRFHPAAALRARGVTIIELLIVLVILVMVTAAAIPIMAPAMKNRRAREAARLASSYFAGARARAIETGRNVGVMVDRATAGNVSYPYGLSLSQVEVPPPYAGDFSNSTAQINVGNASIVGFPNNDSRWSGLLRSGDAVRLNYQGPLYYLSDQTVVTSAYGQAISSPPSTSQWYLFDASGTRLSGTALPPAYDQSKNPNGVPFQIYRQPVRSSTAPLQLPEGMVIDLTASGMGLSGAFGAVSWNPVVMFTPSGGVDSISASTVALTRPTGTIFFLFGRRELMKDVSKTGNNENVYDSNPTQSHLQNFWIAIGPQSGLITVAETGPTSSDTDYANSRQFAVTGQSVGGR